MIPDETETEIDPGQQVKPDIWVLKINETKYWDPSFARKCGRLIGTYLFDRSLHVHCCELTPSYELHFIGTEPTKQVNDEIYDQIRQSDAQCPGADYMHVYHVDGFPVVKEFCSIPRCKMVCIYQLTGDWGDSHEEAMEAAEEYARGNSL